MSAPYLTLTGIDQPPETARLVLSGERDANYLDATFDGHLPQAALQRSVYAAYGGAPLWFMGAQDLEYRLDQGKASTRVRFRAGPYRYAKASRYYLGYYLYDVLERQVINRMLNRLVAWPASGMAVTEQNTTETAFRLFVLNGGRRPSASEQNDLVDELTRHLNVDALVPSRRKFDDAVRRMLERWQTMVRVDNLNYLSRTTEVAMYQDPDNLPEPPLFARCLLDPVELHYPSEAEQTGLPTVDDITMQWPLSLTLRQDEDTLIEFSHYDRQPPSERLGQSLAGSQLQDGFNYWRFGPAWDDYLVELSVGDVPDFENVNPHTLWTYLQPSLNHANLQSRLLQQQNFWPQRLRNVTAPAPADAAALQRLLPGLAVRLRRTGQLYWILETSVSTPPLTMSPKLVKPGVWDADLPAGAGDPRPAYVPAPEPIL